MKKLFTTLFLALFFYSSAQVKLNDNDIKSITTLGQIYSGGEKPTSKSLKPYTGTNLNHIKEVLLLLDGSGKEILTPKYLGRPTNEELQLWYAMDEIRYHKNVDTLNTRTNEQVVREALAKTVDERLLLNNYYRIVEGGIAYLSNNTDMSRIDIDMEKLGFKNDTEKGIFFLNMAHALVTRFRVLNQMKNPDKLLDFAAKLPTFNGNPYYMFTGFGYEDFEYSNDVDKGMYNDVHVSDYYEALMSHFIAAADKGQTALTRQIYFTSILSKPEFFKYSSSKDILRQLYDKSKKH